jgi:hypothetical protein
MRTIHVDDDNDQLADRELCFQRWWKLYWIHRYRNDSLKAFNQYVETREHFLRVMAATRALRAQMMSLPGAKRPLGGR